MSHNYTEPSRLTRLAYRLVYDPLRAGYLRRLVGSLELTGSERVLDFGSGAGSEAVYLARALCRGGRLTCLDVSPTWLAEARRRLRRFENVDFVLGDAAEIELPVAAFDLVLAHYVLHDVDRAVLADTLGSLARALRPGGRLVAVEPLGSRHVHDALSADALRPVMEAAGLVEVSHDEIAAYPGRAVRSVFRRPDAGS